MDDIELKVEARAITLYINGGIWMTNDPIELKHNADFENRATGDVLILGMGMGLVVYPLLFNPKVTSVTIIEIRQGIMDMFRPHLMIADRYHKLHTVRMDAWDFVPDKMYDTIWVDIDELPKDAKVTHPQLIDKFKPFLKVGGWIGGWHVS